MQPGGETGWHGMRQPGRGGRCRLRSLGAWPRGSASASRVSSRACWTTRNMRNPGLGQGRKRLVVASGCREREIRPCSSPVTAPRDAAVPMRLRIFLQRALPAQWVCPGSPRVTAFVMHCVLPSGDQTRAQSGFGVLWPAGQRTEGSTDIACPPLSRLLRPHARTSSSCCRLVPASQHDRNGRPAVT